MTACPEPIEGTPVQPMVARTFTCVIPSYISSRHLLDEVALSDSALIAFLRLLAVVHRFPRSMTSRPRGEDAVTSFT